MQLARTSPVAAVILAFAAGCAGAPRAVPRAPAPAAEEAPAAAAAPPAEPAPLPFHLPCADDDLAGCTSGCADKHSEDCVTLGSIYLAGGPVAVDRDRAFGLFRDACEDGSARGCLRLADAYHAGLLTDEGEEIALYRRACDTGANLGCVAAGRDYLEGRGAPPDPALAAVLFRRVCDRGNADGCLELGRLHRTGEGVPKDAARAAELFLKACKLGLDAGCHLASKKGEPALSPRD